MKYILGVDGGGSKTDILLCDETGSKLAFMEGGPTNYEGLENGVLLLQEELNTIIRKVLTRNYLSTSDIAAAVFGLSGIDSETQNWAVSAVISNAGFKNFYLYNDAFLGIFAGTESGSGICSVNGTGCAAAGIDKTGRQLQVGGLGYITSDYGGGYYLSIETIAAVYRELFRNGEKTLLTELIFKEFGVNDKQNFVNKFQDSGFLSVSNMKKITQLLYTAKNETDSSALKIIARMNTEIAGSINGILSELEFERTCPLDIILSGSVHTMIRDSESFDFLREHIDPSGYFDIRLNYLDRKPVEGAVRKAMQVLLE